MKFDKQRRLHSRNEFDYVFANANKTVTPAFILLHRKNDLSYARIGFALAKKKIAHACTRNLLKRLVRESFRSQTLPAIDIVVLARQQVTIENKLITTTLGYAWEKIISFYAS